MTGGRVFVGTVLAVFALVLVAPQVTGASDPSVLQRRVSLLEQKVRVLAKENALQNRFNEATLGRFSIAENRLF